MFVSRRRCEVIAGADMQGRCWMLTGIDAELMPNAARRLVGNEKCTVLRSTPQAIRPTAPLGVIRYTEEVCMLHV